MHWHLKQLEELKRRRQKQRIDDALDAITQRMVKERPLLYEKLRKTLIELVETPKGTASRTITLSDGTDPVESELLHEWFKAAKSVTRKSPPSLCEFVTAALAKPGTRSQVVGDRLEVFLQDVEAFGEQKARSFYWIDTVKSFWPMLMRILTWSTVAGIGRWLVGLWKA